MNLALASTALLMGLAGGPHCVAMCGAACGAVARGRGTGMAKFQAGRFAGYCVAGGVAGGAVEGFAWLSTHTAALRPAWTLFHLAVLAWGLLLLAHARQPAWVEAAGRSVWARMRPLAASRHGAAAAGALWVFMPCGLLYSALLVASLSGGPVEGAISMALFAFGSGVSLGFAPTLLRTVRARFDAARAGSGTRIAGGLLAAVSLWALGMDLWERVALWCAT